MERDTITFSCGCLGVAIFLFLAAVFIGFALGTIGAIVKWMVG